MQVSHVIYFLIWKLRPHASLSGSNLFGLAMLKVGV